MTPFWQTQLQSPTTIRLRFSKTTSASNYKFTPKFRPQLSTIYQIHQYWQPSSSRSLQDSVHKWMLHFDLHCKSQHAILGKPLFELRQPASVQHNPECDDAPSDCSNCWAALGLQVTEITMLAVRVPMQVLLRRRRQRHRWWNWERQPQWTQWRPGAKGQYRWFLCTHRLVGTVSGPLLHIYPRRSVHWTSGVTGDSWLVSTSSASVVLWWAALLFNWNWNVMESIVHSVSSFLDAICAWWLYGIHHQRESRLRGIGWLGIFIQNVLIWIRSPHITALTLPLKHIWRLTAKREELHVCKDGIPQT